MLWNLLVSLAFQGYINPNLYVALQHYFSIPTALLLSIVFGASAFLLLFYPLAGCLADVKFGRYKATTNSLSVLSLLIAFTISAFVLFLVSAIASQSCWTLIPTIITALIVAPFFLVFLSSIVVFSASVIQFGIDQLRDAPTEDSVTYINWYVWTYYLGVTMWKVSWGISFSNCDAYSFIGLVLPFIIPVGAFIILGVSLCFARYKRHWFLIDSESRNPYKLVYQVIMFAVKHKNPIQRSAFTHCEDELPSRLDLGKEKYGGPFTTEQVENVKAFIGIISLLLTLGPILAVDVASNGTLPLFAQHVDQLDHYDYFSSILSKVGAMAPMAVVIFIPLYIITLRSPISKYIPGMLKRMGMGIFLVTFSLLFLLVIDTVGHTHWYAHQNQTSSTKNLCFLASRYDYNHSYILSNDTLDQS